MRQSAAYADLKVILEDIRGKHKPDITTADVDSTVANMQKNVEAALSFEGSQEEKSAKLWLSSLNIDYNKLSKEEFVTLIKILEKSTILKNRASRRGKTLKKDNYIRIYVFRFIHNAVLYLEVF